MALLDLHYIIINPVYFGLILLARAKQLPGSIFTAHSVHSQVLVSFKEAARLSCSGT